MQDRVGAVFQGRITGVTRFGLFLRLAETGAEGCCRCARSGSISSATTRSATRSSASGRRRCIAGRDAQRALGRSRAADRRLAVRAGGDEDNAAPATKRAHVACAQRTPLTLMQNPFEFDPADANGPVLRPKDAAALVLVRRKGDEARVLMGERSARHAFLPGQFVFPGGRLDVADQRLASRRDLRPEVRAKVAAGTTTSRAEGWRSPRCARPSRKPASWWGRKRRRRAHARGRRGGASSLMACRRGSRRWISSPARSRRRAARADSTRASSWRMRPRSRPSSIVANASGELLKPIWLTLAEAQSGRRAADHALRPGRGRGAAQGRTRSVRPRSVLHSTARKGCDPRALTTRVEVGQTAPPRSLALNLPRAWAFMILLKVWALGQNLTAFAETKYEGVPVTRIFSSPVRMLTCGPGTGSDHHVHRGNPCRRGGRFRRTARRCSARIARCATASRAVSRTRSARTCSAWSDVRPARRPATCIRPR